MSIGRLSSHHPVHAHHDASAAKAPAWTKGLAKLVSEQADNLDAYEHVGPNATDANTAKGKALIATFPKAVQDFFKKQQIALRDNDGDAALLKFPLKEISPNLKGNALAVRWTSEDGTLDRLFVFDATGKPVTKGWTDTGANFKWQPAKGPFAIDDSPHS
jgi:hypothetical protein